MSIQDLIKDIKDSEVSYDENIVEDGIGSYECHGFKGNHVEYFTEVSIRFLIDTKKIDIIEKEILNTDYIYDILKHKDKWSIGDIYTEWIDLADNKSILKIEYETSEVDR